MGLITFDLDSTLADTRHRHHLIKPEGMDWDAYADTCGQDGLIRAQAALWWALAPHHSLWVVTGRPRASEGRTAVWLARHGLEPSGQLFVGSSNGDYLKRKVAALQWIEITFGRRILFHVDDYPPMFEECRAVGIECIIIQSPQTIDAFDPERKTYV